MGSEEVEEEEVPGMLCMPLARFVTSSAEAFTAAHPEFELINAAEALEAAGVSRASELVSPAGHLRLWPHKHATDGFYAAVWQRKE